MKSASPASHREAGRAGGKKFLYWTPRILSIVMACFVTIFAFDVFDNGLSGWKLALSLLMHLLPTIIMVLFIVIAWKMENLGGWLFVALGVAFVFMGNFKLATILIVTLPTVIIGAMYLWHYHKYIKGMKDSATPATLNEK